MADDVAPDEIFSPLTSNFNFCLFCSADILSLNLTFERVLSTRLSGEHLSRNLRLNCVMFSLKVAFEQLVLRRRNASPLIKPFLTPGGWQDVKCVIGKFLSV